MTHCFVVMLLWFQIRHFRLGIFRLRNPILNVKDFSMFNVGFFSLAETLIHLQKKLLLLTLRLLMSYIYGPPILDVSRSHTTTQHSR